MTTAQENEMDTLAGPIIIPGWDEMAINHQTRAIVLQCLTNFVLEHIIPPTKKQLLDKVIEQQEMSDIEPLSPTSTKTIQDHLDNLVEDGYVYRLGFGQTADSGQSKTGRRKARGRGGPARCFWPASVKLIVERNFNYDNKGPPKRIIKFRTE
jgi:hypothetical protein